METSTPPLSSVPSPVLPPSSSGGTAKARAPFTPENTLSAFYTALKEMSASTQVVDLTDQILRDQAQAARDTQDALAGALYSMMAIPADMMRPNANGRIYSSELFRQQIARFRQRLVLAHAKSDQPVAHDPSEWPGRWLNPHCQGCVRWGLTWNKPVVAAVNWVAPKIKPPSRWHEEIRKAFGVEGSVVPISTQPVNEEKRLPQTSSRLTPGHTADAISQAFFVRTRSGVAEPGG